MSNALGVTTITVRMIGDEPMIDAAAMSLLFGIDADTISATLSGGSLAIPQLWLKAGRRRASEARAATGHSDMVSALEYWCRKDHGTELEIVYQ